MSAPAINLEGRTVLRLSGGDRQRYLNGQVTNDVSKLDDKSAMAACVTTIKGKLDALVWITKVDGAYLIDSEPELRESLFMRLDKYIIADDCELTDVSDEWELFHVLDSPEPGGETYSRHSERLGVRGHDLWIPDDFGHFGGLELISTEEEEELRIRNGIPKWGVELTPDTLPAEAGLDQYAIDFHKGCYIGQEVISRIESVGRVNRKLVRLRVEKGESPQVGSPLFDGEKEVGILTSVSGSCGLGFARRDHNEPGTILTPEPVTDPEKKSLSTRLEIVESLVV